MAPHHVSVRLDAATMARVDALAPTFSTEWHAATRSDVLRALILDALGRFEHSAEAPAPEKRRTRLPAPRRR